MRIPTILTAALAALALGAGCATVDDGVTAESSSQPLVQAPVDDGADDGVGQAGHRCPHFVDEDGDGVCDRRAAGDCQGRCGGGFVDEDGDGVCDNAAKGGCGRGPGFVDEDGDGVCDNAKQRRGRNFVDDDGDGVCDHHQARQRRGAGP